MGDDIIAMDLYIGAMLAGVIIVLLSIAIATWSVLRATQRLEKRLADHLVQRIREELARPSELQADCAIEQAEDTLSEDVLELSEPVDGEFLKSEGETSNDATHEYDKPSVEEVLSSMARVIRAEKKKQRHEEKLTERLGRQIHDELTKLERKKIDRMVVQAGNELADQGLDKLDYEQQAEDDPTMEELLSKMRQVTRNGRS